MFKTDKPHEFVQFSALSETDCAECLLPRGDKIHAVRTVLIPTSQKEARGGQVSTENDPPPGMSGTFHLDGSQCSYIYEHKCHHPTHGDLAGVQFDDNHNPTTTPTTGGTMSDASTDGTDVDTAQMMLAFGVNENGEALSNEERTTLERFVASATGEAGASAPAPEAPSDETDLQALIRQEVLKQAAALGAAPAQAPQQGDPLINALQQLDPRDSEAALTMLQYLIDTKRLSVVGSLNGGGYLFHYAEPKGTSKAGYVPGGTQGGRMVDQAVDQAKAAGAKPRKTGLCDQCWSAVEQQEDGTVVTDDGSKNAVCAQGGAHTFHG